MKKKCEAEGKREGMCMRVSQTTVGEEGAEGVKEDQDVLISEGSTKEILSSANVLSDLMTLHRLGTYFLLKSPIWRVLNLTTFPG